MKNQSKKENIILTILSVITTIGAIIIFLMLLKLSTKPTPYTPGGDKTFSSFWIEDDNIPTLTTGYSATNWTQTVITDPTPADSIDYTIDIPTQSNLNGKLIINTSGSSTTRVELELAAGVVAATYEYTIHGVAHKDGYTDYPTNKVCSLTISNPIPPHLVLLDDSEYSIDTSGTFLTDRTNSDTFDFTDLNGTSYSFDRDQIKEIYLTNLPQITTAPDNYLRYLCADMINLIVADIKIPDTIISTGDNFCDLMFWGCESLTSLPFGFNIPQNITTIGNTFCEGMFLYCENLISLPTNFNLPQNITTIGDDFCYAMFENCISLATLPSGFNLPQGITSVGEYFCGFMFEECYILNNNNTSNSTTINIPNLSGNDHYCFLMFDNCSLLDHSNWTYPTPNPGESITINAN